MCTELRNRGVEDVLMAVCDGLKGLPDAIGEVWPQTVVQSVWCIMPTSGLCRGWRWIPFGAGV